MKHRLRCGLAAAIAATAGLVAQEPTYQGRKLAQWFDQPILEQPSDLVRFDGGNMFLAVNGESVCQWIPGADITSALAALAPGTQHEGRALELLLANIRKDARGAVALGAFGARGLELLRQHRAALPNGAYARGVFAAGPAGIDELLQAMREPGTDSAWWEAGTGAGTALVAALLSRAGRHDADGRLALRALQCCRTLPDDAFAVLGPWLEDADHSQTAETLLQKLSPSGLRPVLVLLGERQAFGRNQALWKAIEASVSRWSLADADCVPLLQAMLRTQQARAARPRRSPCTSDLPPVRYARSCCPPRSIADWAWKRALRACEHRPVPAVRS